MMEMIYLIRGLVHARAASRGTVDKDRSPRKENTGGTGWNSSVVAGALDLLESMTWEMNT